MESEAKITIAFLFKHSGKNELKDSEIYLPLSIELDWFSTKEAHQFVKYALKQKLLIRKDGLLTPSFDIKNIDIPVGFSPTKKTFVSVDRLEEENNIKNNITDTIAHRIGEKTNQDPEDIADEIKQVALEKNVFPEVASLLIARGHDIVIEDAFEPVKNEIFRENEE